MFSVLVVVLAVSACATTRGVRLEADPSLQRCEPQEIQFADIPSLGARDCEFIGSVVVFPDGKTMEVGDYNSAAAHTGLDISESKFYRVISFGRHGISATFTDGGQNIEMKASTPEAMKFHITLEDPLEEIYASVATNPSS